MAAYKKHLIQTKNRDLLNAVSLCADIETYCNIDSSPQSHKKKQEQAALISRLVIQTNTCHYLAVFTFLASYFRLLQSFTDFLSTDFTDFASNESFHFSNTIHLELGSTTEFKPLQTLLLLYFVVASFLLNHSQKIRALTIPKLQSGSKFPQNLIIGNPQNGGPKF